MRLALLADIHANLEALEACLEHAGRKAVDAYAFIGDIVGYCADPGPVVDRVIGLMEGGLAVRGNHDAAVVKVDAETMNAAAESAAQWTAGQLSDRHRMFLASLPLTVRRHETLFVHGSAEEPAGWIYVTDTNRAFGSLRAARANWVFSGHVHVSDLYYMGESQRPVPFKPVPGTSIPVHPRRQWLGVIGAVGQPRDGNTAATYAIMDYKAYSLTYHRVPYDWHAAAAKIRAAGLPEKLAARLGKGE